MQFEKGFEGLTCLLQTEVALKDDREGWNFKCQCKLETLRITEDVLRGELGARWHQLMNFQKFVQEWNGQLASAGDFVEYFKRLTGLRSRRRSKGSSDDVGLLGGVETTFNLNCSRCKRTYRFQISLRSPLDFTEEMDFLEAYRKLKFDLSKKETETLLEMEAVKLGLNGRYELAKHVETLESETAQIGAFLDELAAIPQKYDHLESDLAVSLIKSVADSIGEIRKEYVKESEADLKRILNGISTRCEELLMVPVEAP